MINKLGHLRNDEKCLDPAWVVAVSKVESEFVLDIIVEVVVIEVKVWIEVKVGTDTGTVELRALRRRVRAKRHGFLPNEDLMKSSNAPMNTLIAFAQLLSSRLQVFVN